MCGLFPCIPILGCFFFKKKCISEWCIQVLPWSLSWVAGLYTTIIDIVLVCLLLTQNRFHTLLYCLCCWLWQGKCPLGRVFSQMFHISTICKKTLDDSDMLNQGCNFIFREKAFRPGLTLYDFCVTPEFSHPGFVLVSTCDI